MENKEPEEFIKETLEFHLPDEFKELPKEYIMDCIFDSDIQDKWVPQVGDIIVGCTGNVFVISGMDNLSDKLGGNKYYFGGGCCNRDGGIVMDSTFCFTANESGRYIHPIDGEQNNLYHSSIREFKFVPYPHEKC